MDPFSQAFILQLSEALRPIIRAELAAAGLEASNKPEPTQAPITQKQLCKYMNVSEQTVIRWKAKKRIPFLLIGTKPRYILADVLKAMEKK